MTASSLPSLISDLEAAKEGSRELSDRVLLARGWHYTLDGISVKTTGLMVRPSDGKPLLPEERPDPTRSLDSAVALVDAPFWSIRIGGGTKRGWAAIHTERKKYEAKAATPALALTACALHMILARGKGRNE